MKRFYHSEKETYRKNVKYRVYKINTQNNSTSYFYELKKTRMIKKLLSLKHWHINPLFLAHKKSGFTMIAFYKNRLLLIFFTFLFGSLFSQKKILTEKQIDSVYISIVTDKLFNDRGITKVLELYNKAKQANYVNGQIKTLYRLAELESGLSNYTKSLDYINILKPLALSNENYEYYVNALCIESKNFYCDKNYTQSLKILNQAKIYIPNIENIEAKRKAKIDVNIYKYFTFQISKIPEKSYRDSMIVTSKKVCAESFLLKDKKIRANRLLFSSTWAAQPLIDLDRLAEANKYLKIGESQLKLMDENSYAVADFYEAKGDFEFKNNKKNINSSITHYLKSLKICNSIGYDGRLKTLYPKIAEAYGITKNYEKKLYFLEKHRKLRDKLDNLSNNSLNDFKQKAYETKDNSTTNNIVVVSILLIAFVLVLLILYYTYFKKNSTKKELKEEIKSENKIDSSPAKKLISLLFEDEKAFYLAFNETYPNFSKKLLQINPTIKPSDVEFCALIKLNLETKEIASLKKCQ